MNHPQTTKPGEHFKRGKGVKKRNRDFPWMNAKEIFAVKWEWKYPLNANPVKDNLLNGGKRGKLYAFHPTIDGNLQTRGRRCLAVLFRFFQPNRRDFPSIQCLILHFPSVPYTVGKCTCISASSRGPPFNLKGVLLNRRSVDARTYLAAT